MGAVKGSGKLTDQALAEAFHAFEGENGRQAKVLVVGDAETKAQARAAVGSGVVGGLTVELDTSYSGGWELREASALREDEARAADVQAVDGTVNAYPALAEGSGSHDPSRLSHPASAA